MAADESALVPVSPDDTIQLIIDKVRRTGAANVELLVPDDTAVLQTPGGFDRLRRAFDADQIGLLVISSDQQTLDAARRNRFETVGVQGARVMPPSAQRYATRQLPATPIDDRDTEFLDALDHVPAEDRYADLDADDADLYAVLDDLPGSAPARGSASRAPRDADEDRGLDADDDFAAALDDWAGTDDRTPTRPARVERDDEREPARRFSATDFDLSEDDRRQRRDRRVKASRDRAEAQALPVRDTAARRPRGSAAGRLRDYDEDEVVAPRRSYSKLLIPLVIVLVIVLALAYWLLSSRVTLAVTPPSSSAGEQVFTNEVIPLAQPGANAATAIQASPVSADAEATVSGNVQKETLSPSGTAKGTVTIINTIESAVPMPKGTEFVGKNAKGEEVRFTLDADAVVPAATTTSSTAGRSTTYGQIVVGITARSAGSASNVDTNSIKSVIIPGEQPIVSDNSNFIIRNEPIGGGSEAPQRIVTDADVQGVLGQALSALYSNGVDQLKAQIADSQASLDETTVIPSSQALGDPQSYEPPVVEPAVGQPVDAANPVFKVTVRARFNALATPSGKAVSSQLQNVAPQYFVQRPKPPCAAGERPAIRVDRSGWDGEKFTIDGAINCLPAEGLSADAIGKVKDAVRNQPHDIAVANLEGLKQNGVIGSYQLPDKASFTGFDWLISVQVDPSPAVQAQPTPPIAPQPTQGTQ